MMVMVMVGILFTICHIIEHLCHDYYHIYGGGDGEDDDDDNDDNDDNR